MSYLKNIINSDQELVVNNNAAFWDWFLHNEKQFYNAVSQKQNIETDFFNPLSDRLEELREGFYFVTGMADEQTAELIFTADGKIKNFVFVEALVAQAPAIPGWKFTAHKPAMNAGNMRIKMSGHLFNAENIWFYSNVLSEYPDEIDIMIVHKDYTPENKDVITNGCFLFLDNLLGEMNYASVIDVAQICGPAEATQELVPVTKLNAFMEWRQKEFIEKYEGVSRDTANDAYRVLQATLENGDPLAATVNTDILMWNDKASHPWISIIEIRYDGSENQGMPSPKTFALLEKMESDLRMQLKDSDGHLFIAHQTGDGVREIYFACKEFRKPSFVISEVIREYADRIDINYEIYKDKYWMTMNRFMN